MKRFLWISILTLFLVATLAAADAAWKWVGSYGDKAVEMLIIGDIQVQGARRGDPTSAFGRVRETLKRADLVYANLEGVLVRSGGTGVVDMPDKRWVHPGPEGVVALKANNIKAVGVANNVAWGRENIMQTLKILRDNGIAYAGAGKNIEEAHKPAILERKGVKIGFLQYTARWYRQEHQMATATEPGVARIMSKDGITIDPGDLELMKKDVQKLRPQVDIIVVSHHNRDGATPVQFGEPERQPNANPTPRPANAPRADRTKSEEYQKLFARTAMDMGADFVFGHGTHTVQGVEVYKGKLILYAVGHSAFDQPGYEDSKDGMVVRVVIQNKNIQRVSFVPVTRDQNNDVYMVDPANGEGARLLGIIQKVSDLPLKIEGQEVVLLDKGNRTTASRNR